MVLDAANLSRPPTVKRVGRPPVVYKPKIGNTWKLCDLDDFPEDKKALVFDMDDPMTKATHFPDSQEKLKNHLKILGVEVDYVLGVHKSRLNALKKHRPAWHYASELFVNKQIDPAPLLMLGDEVCFFQWAEQLGRPRRIRDNIKEALELCAPGMEKPFSRYLTLIEELIERQGIVTEKFRLMAKDGFDPRRAFSFDTASLLLSFIGAQRAEFEDNSDVRLGAEMAVCTELYPEFCDMNERAPVLLAAYLTGRPLLHLGEPDDNIAEAA